MHCQDIPSAGESGLPYCHDASQVEMGMLFILMIELLFIKWVFIGGMSPFYSLKNQVSVP